MKCIRLLVCLLVLFAFWGTSSAIADGGQCCVSEISSNFNGTAIPSGDTIWFNAVVNVSGRGTNYLWLAFVDQTIEFSVKGQCIEIPAPDTFIQWCSSVKYATVTYCPVYNCWNVLLPRGYTGNVFLGGVGVPVSSLVDVNNQPVRTPLPGGINPVTWSGTFLADEQVTVNWKWAAAVYKCFDTDYNCLGVKPVDGGSFSHFGNSDHAGTPEYYKGCVVGGARGGGGANYTGSYSGTGHATPCYCPDCLE